MTGISDEAVEAYRRGLSLATGPYGDGDLEDDAIRAGLAAALPLLHAQRDADGPRATESLTDPATVTRPYATDPQRGTGDPGPVSGAVPSRPLPAEWVDTARTAALANFRERISGNVADSPEGHSASLADAVLAALTAADLLVTPRGQRATDHPTKPCTYVSKACQHATDDGIEELHGRCRIQCKFCPSTCGCACHVGEKGEQP